jgi:hypothetical protein
MLPLFFIKETLSSHKDELAKEEASQSLISQYK